MQSPTGMGQKIGSLHVFHGSRIEDELFQKPRVRFDGWYKRRESWWSAPQGRHLEGLHGSLEFLPGLTVVKSFP